VASPCAPAAGPSPLLASRLIPKAGGAHLIEKGTPMNEGTVIQDPQALSETLMTEERAYMARWLALEVLMTDEAVCCDEDLFDKLSAARHVDAGNARRTRGNPNAMSQDPMASASPLQGRRRRSGPPLNTGPGIFRKG
jgi:hypothetical protein